MENQSSDSYQDPLQYHPEHSSLGWYILTVVFVLTCALWIYATPIYLGRFVFVSSEYTQSGGQKRTIEPDGSIPGRGKNELGIVFFNVGYGDGILIQTPDGTMTLIDGGEGKFPDSDNAPPLDFGHRLYIPFFEKIDRRNIENFISTVSYSHHMGALSDLMANQNIEVDNLYHSGYPARFYSYRRMMVLARENNVNVQEMKSGQQLDLGRGLKAAVVYAKENIKVKARTSRVLYLKYGEKSFLLMSDLPAREEENMILDWGKSLKTDLLKIGRHGAGDATSRSLLRFVNPHYAVLSVNEKNPLGAPDEDVMKRLKQNQDISLLRTDQDGHISVFTDGQSIRVVKNSLTFL